MSYKGIYRPENPQKYIGDPNGIVYRSLWERKFFVYCDRESKVKRWASEEFSIRYYNPVRKKVSRYFPDVYIEYIDRNNSLVKSLIEIKPEHQTKLPKKGKKKSKTYMTEVVNYTINQAKWKAAEEFCLDNGWVWRIITEKELGI